MLSFTSSHNAMRHVLIAIVGIFVLLGSLWICFGESVIGWLLHDPTVKPSFHHLFFGFVYILFTSSLLYLIFSQLFRRMQASEQAFEESYASFRSIFESAAVGVALVDSATGRFIRVNAKYCTITGYSSSDLEEKTFYEITHPDDQAVDLLSLAELRAGNIRSFSREQRYFSKSGATVWVNLAVSANWQPGEAPTSHVVVVEDITARKEVELALRNSQERLSMALAASQMGVWEWNLQTNAVIWSPECYGITGLKDFNGTFDGFATVLHPDDATRTVQCVERCLADNLPYADQFRIIRPDGQLRWLSNKGKVSYDAAGSPLLLTGTVQDITEAKQIHDRLQQSEQRYRAVVEDQTEFICRMDAEGRITFVNDTYCRFFGKSVNQLLGSTWHPVVVAEDFPQIEASLATLSSENPVVIIENRVYDATGEIRWGQFVNRGIFDENGRLLEIQVVARDISSQKHAEAALVENEAFIADVLDSLTSHVAVVDENGVITRVNEEWRRFARENGAPENLVIGVGLSYLDACRNFVLRQEDDGAEAACAGITEILKGRQDSFTLEYSCHSPEQRRWFLMTVSVLKGSKQGVVISHVDITGRRETEDALAQVMREQSIILDNVPVGIAKKIGRMQVWVNRKVEELVGYAKEEMESQSTRKLYPTDEAYEKLGQEAYPVLGKGELFETVQELVRKDGAHIFVRYIGKALDPVDMSKGVLWILEDITERRIAEQALRESEERYRSLVEQMHEGVAAMDASCTVTFANTRFLQIVERPATEVIGTNLLDLFSNQRPLLEQHLKLRKEGGTSSYQLELPRNDGILSYAIVIGSPRFDDRGEFIGSIAVINDVTDRVRAEMAFRESHERLRNLSMHLETVRENERKAIAREVHDELGQLLTAMRYDLVWLKKNLAVADQLPHWRHLDSLDSIVEEAIKSVQKVTAQLRPKLLDELGLKAAVEWQISNFSERSGIRCDALVREILPSLPSESSIAILRIIQEAFTNIMRHAEATEVFLSLVPQEENVLLTIIDNGRGITLEELQASTSYGLMGMRERAAACGGMLEIVGAAGKGTTLRLIMPLKGDDGAQSTDS